MTQSVKKHIVNLVELDGSKNKKEGGKIMKNFRNNDLFHRIENGMFVEKKSLWITSGLNF